MFNFILKFLKNFLTNVFQRADILTVMQKNYESYAFIVHNILLSIVFFFFAVVICFVLFVYGSPNTPTYFVK